MTIQTKRNEFDYKGWVGDARALPVASMTDGRRTEAYFETTPVDATRAGNESRIDGWHMT